MQRMDEVEEVCAFCHLRCGRSTSKSKAKGDPLVCSVCHQEWKPQLVAHTEDGPVRLRPRPTTVPKTVNYELCTSEKCRGAQCIYAHSQYELHYWFQMRVQEEPRLYHPTGRLPPYWLCNHRAYCSRGVQCFFPHSILEKENWEKSAHKSKPQDSASYIRPLRPNYSCIKLCRNMPDCRFGQKCRYAHSEDELAAWDLQGKRSEKSSYSHKSLSPEAKSRTTSNALVKHQTPQQTLGFRFTQEECCTEFRKAVTNHATVRLCIVKVMTVGHARVGKTWLRNLLLGQAQEHSHSTPVLGSALTVSAFKDQRKVMSDTVSASGSEWTVIDTPNHITAYLQLLQREDYTKGQPRNKKVKEVPQGAHPAHSMKKTVDNTSMFKSTGQSTLEPHAQPQAYATQGQISAMQPVASCIYNAIRTVDFKQQHIDLCNTRLIQFMDTGGQLAYHDILPVFITTPAVYLHVFNLSQPLDDYPEDKLELENGKCLASGASPLSTLEMVSRSMLTVHTFANKKMKLPCLASENCTYPTRMVLVGTHLDKLEEEQRDGKENVEDRLKGINRELHMGVPFSLYPVRCVWEDETHTMFFPVNNLLNHTGSIPSNALEAATDPATSRSAVAKQTSAQLDGQIPRSNQLKWVQQLKDEVEKVAEAVKLDIPVKWYLHQLAISSQNDKPFRVYGELLQFCLENQVVDSAFEFQEMVTLFHALGLWVHHDVEKEPDEVEKHGEHSKCLIFTNPSFLYQKISTMYVVQFQLQTVEEMIVLKDMGIFSEEAFMQLKLHESFQCDWFMNLLQCLHIGAEMEYNSKKAVFVPSVLTANKPFFTADDEDTVRTFVITFQPRKDTTMRRPLQYIPSGVFTGAIVHLLQSEGNWSPVTDYISRLAMTFKIDGTNYVQLSDCTTFIKVQIDTDDDTMSHSYRDAVLTAVSHAYKQLKFNEADLILGLPCPKEAAHIEELVVPHGFKNRGVGRLAVTCKCHSGKRQRQTRMELQEKEAEIFLKLSHEAVHSLQHTFDKKSAVKEDDTMSQKVTDRADCLMLFREHVSRAAAGKGRAVLEGLRLKSNTIEACFQSNPLREEEAVQMGLVKWKDGQGLPPTWKNLVDAMQFAQIEKSHVTELKKKLGLP